MRRLCVALFTSLDGFLSGPGRSMDWVGETFSAEEAEALGENQLGVDAFLFGRQTYIDLAGYSPQQTTETEPSLAHQ
ncbi:MAG: hypothetical protein ACXVY8_10315 [Gaiellaceae bacterium]